MRTSILIFLTLFTGFLFGQNHLSKRDSNFVINAYQHTLLEIKLADLAQGKSSSGEVKSLAATLHASHTKASVDLKQLAVSKNITLPSQISDKEQTFYDKMNKKEGASFDKTYTKCAVKSHKWGACYVKKESKKAKDADIKSWASSYYPVLEQNKDKAKETCKALKHKN
jgi:putative membrane protein